MSHPETAPTPRHAGLRGELSRDHSRLDQLLGDLRAAFDADAREDAARLWGELDRGLSAHLEFEERHVLPAFRAVDSTEVEGLLREHSYWKGAYHDLELYAVLRREFDGR